MWKRAFIALLLVNLLLIAGAAIWLGFLPDASRAPATASHSDFSHKAATVQLAVGEDAINTYLEYAVAEQADVRKALAYAQVKFGQYWGVQMGVKMSGKIVPCDIEFSPEIQQGNLDLHIRSASVGGIPVPTSLLVILFRHLPWPDWINVDTNREALDLNFSERPQHPYGLRMAGYSPQTKLLTVWISILPKTLLSHQ